MNRALIHRLSIFSGKNPIEREQYLILSKTFDITLVVLISFSNTFMKIIKK